MKTNFRPAQRITVAAVLLVIGVGCLNFRTPNDHPEAMLVTNLTSWITMLGCLPLVAGIWIGFFTIFNRLAEDMWEREKIRMVRKIEHEDGPETARSVARALQEQISANRRAH